jgi:hypothetical protein
MMQFSAPWRLLWLLPWAALCLLVLRHQLDAFGWLEDHSSARGLRRLSHSTRRGLTARVAAVFAMGALLGVGLAGPHGFASAEQVSETPSVILLVDGSLSMGTPDAVRLSGDAEPVPRITLAAEFCRELVSALPDETSWGLITFSGEAVVHSPPTTDDFALETLLNNLSIHVFSQTSGSRFSAAFEAVAHLMAHAPSGLQVVLLSDGELSHEDDYGDSLGALAALGIPVHTVGFGSREWTDMTVWVMEDVIANAETKRTAAQYRTRRESRDLERMAGVTGGVSLVAEHGEWVGEMVAAIGRAPTVRRASRAAVMVDRSRWFVAAAALMLIGLCAGLPDRRRVGPLLVVLVLAPLCSGCGHPLMRAHRLNERGLAELAAGDHPAATRSFETSLAFDWRPQVPMYNLGNTAMAEEDYLRAHQSYERALQLRPRFAAAHFNDGHALYLWAPRNWTRNAVSSNAPASCGRTRCGALNRPPPTPGCGAGSGGRRWSTPSSCGIAWRRSTNSRNAVRRARHRRREAAPGEAADQGIPRPTRPEGAAEKEGVTALTAAVAPINPSVPRNRRRWPRSWNEFGPRRQPPEDSARATPAS